MKLLYFSVHGDGTSEMAQLCNYCGVELWIPDKDTQHQFKHHQSRKEWVIRFKNNNVKIVQREELFDKIRDNFWQALIFANPEQIDLFKKHLLPLNKNLKFFIRHGVNSAEKFKKCGVRNILTPSRRFAYENDFEHVFISRKMLDLNFIDKHKRINIEDRKDFATFIHYYQKHWPLEYKRCKLLQSLSNIRIQHFGYKQQNGLVPDKTTMPQFKSLIHIKGGQVCCNAPLKALSIGLPVITDWSTIIKTQMEDYLVHEMGSFVGYSILDLIPIVRRLDNDKDFLLEHSQRAKDFAQKKLRPDKELKQRFIKFLEDLRPCK